MIKTNSIILTIIINTEFDNDYLYCDFGYMLGWCNNYYELLFKDKMTDICNNYKYI